MFFGDTKPPLSSSDALLGSRRFARLRRRIQTKCNLQVTNGLCCDRVSPPHRRLGIMQAPGAKQQCREVLRNRPRLRIVTKESDPAVFRFQPGSVKNMQKGGLLSPEAREMQRAESSSQTPVACLPQQKKKRLFRSKSNCSACRRAGEGFQPEQFLPSPQRRRPYGFRNLCVGSSTGNKDIIVAAQSVVMRPQSGMYRYSPKSRLHEIGFCLGKMQQHHVRNLTALHIERKACVSAAEQKPRTNQRRQVEIRLAEFCLPQRRIMVNPDKIGRRNAALHESFVAVLRGTETVAENVEDVHGTRVKDYQRAKRAVRKKDEGRIIVRSGTQGLLGTPASE